MSNYFKYFCLKIKDKRHHSIIAIHANKQIKKLLYSFVVIKATSMNVPAWICVWNDKTSSIILNERV